MHFTNDILKLQISVFHRILIVRNHCLFAIPTYLQEIRGSKLFNVYRDEVTNH